MGPSSFLARSHGCQLLERDPLHYPVIAQTNPGGGQHKASRGLGSALSSLQCFHIIRGLVDIYTGFLQLFWRAYLSI